MRQGAAAAPLCWFVSLSSLRTDSHGPSGSSSSQTGQNKACQSQGKASSTSSAKCIKQKSSLVRMDPYRSTVGKKDTSLCEKNRADVLSISTQNSCLLFYLMTKKLSNNKYLIFYI